MAQHELVLLSPYRFPGQSPLMLSNDDMACWLNGSSALWHPALLWNAKGPPRTDAQYDHETPQAGFVYALPESPPLYLPDDWEDRVRAAGSIAFKAGVDRAATLDNLRKALETVEGGALGWPAGLGRAEAGTFFGLGFGHLLLATLAEAMEHENLLDAAGFWDDVQRAVALLAGFEYSSTSDAPVSESLPEENGLDSADTEVLVESPPALDSPPEDVNSVDGWRDHLCQSAQKLVSARDVLYPVAIHLLDICLLDDNAMEQPW